MAPILESAHISNYKSLGNVSLHFRKLTIIAGANSSGKSCCLEALSLLKLLVKASKAPPAWFLEDKIRIGKESDGIILQVCILNTKNVDYSIHLALQDNSDEDSVILSEQLIVSKTRVISITKGEGEVRDENNQGKIPYRSTPNTVALSSTGSYGKKPVTQSISDFVKQWEFYDLDPDFMRGYESSVSKIEGIEKPVSLDVHGRQLQGLLQSWASDSSNHIFEKVSEEVRRCLNIDLVLRKHKGQQVIKIKENGGLEILFDNSSDGTLRMIGYCSLLHSPVVPTVIAIEEPERNLHPGILIDLASILKRLSQKTQVIITTHSSQLLDCFNLEDISNDVSVLLVKKDSKVGTEAFSLDKLRQDCDGLQDWMQDFGIGNAIYHSNLIQEVLEH